MWHYKKITLLHALDGVLFIWRCSLQLEANVLCARSAKTPVIYNMTVLNEHLHIRIQSDYLHQSRHTKNTQTHWKWPRAENINTLHTVSRSQSHTVLPTPSAPTSSIDTPHHLHYRQSATFPFPPPPHFTFTNRRPQCPPEERKIPWKPYKTP